MTAASARHSTIKRSLFLMAALCLFRTFAAHADIYTCKDNAGHVTTSDRPIPECASKSTQVYQNNGSLKSQFSGELTPEQRKAAQLQQQQQTQEAARQENIRREQRYLSAHYPDEAAIEVARKKTIDAVEMKIANETHTLTANNEALRKNQNVLAVTPQNQQAKIHELMMKADDLSQSIAESTRLISNYRNEEANINRQFDDTHKRYNELIPAGR